MDIQEYIAKQYVDCTLPSCGLAFRMRMPSALTVEKMSIKFYAEAKAAKGDEQKTREVMGDFFVGLLKACTFPDGLTLDDISLMEDLTYLTDRVIVFFGIGVETQTKDGASEKASLPSPPASSGQDTNSQEDSLPTT